MLVWYNRFFKFITGLFPPSDLFTRNRLLKNCLTSFLFLDSPKWIDLYSFFDCEEPWPGLDPREMGFCNPVQFPNFFSQLVPSISLINVVNMPANFTFGSVSGKNNPITTECIFPCGINSGRMLQKSFFFWRVFYLKTLVCESWLVQLCYMDLVFSKNWLYSPTTAFLCWRAPAKGLQFPFAHQFEQLLWLLTGFNCFSNVVLKFISKQHPVLPWK